MSKAGIKTTEFWLALLAAAVGGYGAFYRTLHGQDARTVTICTAAVAAIYAFARALVKIKGEK